MFSFWAKHNILSSVVRRNDEWWNKRMIVGSSTYTADYVKPDNAHIGIYQEIGITSTQTWPRTRILIDERLLLQPYQIQICQYTLRVFNANLFNLRVQFLMNLHPSDEYQVFDKVIFSIPLYSLGSCLHTSYYWDRYILLATSSVRIFCSRKLFR